MEVNLVPVKDCATNTTSPMKPSSFDGADAVPSGCSSISTEPFSTSDGSIVSHNDTDLESLTNDMARMRASSSAGDACGPSLSRSSSLMKSTKSYSELKWADPPLEALAEPSTLTVSFASDTGIGCSTTDVAVPPPERLPLDASTTALLVVDVQPQYWSECPSVRKDFPDFPKKLSQTIATCRQRGAKLIFVRADYRYAHSPWLAQFERLHGGRPDMRSEVPCDPNSEDFQWEEFATPEGGDVILPKTSWSSSSNPKLMEWLRASGIDTVLVCGLITSVCVQHSAFSIFEAGFRTLLVTDACGDRGRARHNAALALYGDYMYELVTANDLDDPERGLVKAKPVWLSLDSDAESKSTASSNVGNVQDKALKTTMDKTGATVVHE